MLTVPNIETIHTTVNTFRQMVLTEERNRQVLIEEKLDEIGARLEHSSQKHLKCLTEEIKISSV